MKTNFLKIYDCLINLDRVLDIKVEPNFISNACSWSVHIKYDNEEFRDIIFDKKEDAINGLDKIGKFLECLDANNIFFKNEDSNTPESSTK